MIEVLLTNDDGIDAPGLQALWDAVAAALRDSGFGESRMIVVAPDQGRSECGHSVTTGQSLVLEPVKEDWFALNGTPVDCVRAALGTVASRSAVVFSGVNAGANLGVDLMVSGTFAAAREASLHGCPAIALSHYRRPDVPKTWDHVPAWTRSVLTEFLTVSVGVKPRPSKNNRPQHAELWNVNLPAIEPSAPAPELRWCSADPSPFERTAELDQGRVAFNVDFHGRPRLAEHDVDLCFRGLMTVSRMSPHFQHVS
ncbi:MAG: 5'/3'-nucleotidase SurE [Planctomycetota bacterium]